MKMAYTTTATTVFNRSYIGKNVKKDNDTQRFGYTGTTTTAAGNKISNNFYGGFSGGDDDATKAI